MTHIQPIKLIKTTCDYEQALQEIESLFDAVPNTPEGDRLYINDLRGCFKSLECQSLLWPSKQALTLLSSFAQHACYRDF